MKLTKLAILASVLALLSACQTQTPHIEHMLWVAPQTSTCTGVVERQCLQVKRANEPWTHYYDDIEGFNFIEGSFHQLRVTAHERATPAADQSSQYLRLQEQQKHSNVVLLDNSMLNSQRQWQLKSLASLPAFKLATLKTIPFVTVSSEGLTGHAGCNRLFANDFHLFESQQASQSWFKVHHLASTRMLCHPNTVAVVEQALISALQDANQLVVVWPKLRLYDNGKEIATFVAQDWD